MNRDINRYLPFPVLCYKIATQPFWDFLAMLSRVVISIIEKIDDVKYGR